MLTALLIAAATMTASPASDRPPPHDCESARALPAEATPDDRRVACTIPEKYRLDVAVAEQLGRELRTHDVAAWLTTDALVERRAIGGAMPKGWRGSGWITRRIDGGIRVDYTAVVDGTPSSYAAATLRSEPFGVVDARQLEPVVALDERGHRLHAARLLAEAHGSAFFCNRHAPNVAAFEWEDADGPQILVFFLTAWKDDVPLGGFHMYRVDAAATRVIDHFSQTKGCLVASAKDFERIEAQMVSHVTSAAPTLFHVFMNLQYRKPIYVSTAQNGLLWKIDGGRISLVDQRGSASTGETSP